jgi:uncharacterized protein with FMN-binding domain
MVLKASHITFVSLVGGGLFSMMLLFLVKRGLGQNDNIFMLDLSIFKIFSWVVNYSFFGIIATALIYSLFTLWGFFKHHWILLKWVLLIGMFILTWSLLGPSINGMTSLSDAGFHLTGSQDDYTTFIERSFLYTLIEFGLVIGVIFISTIKPLGIWRVQRTLNRRVVSIIVIVLAIVVVGLSLSSSLSLRKYRRMTIEDSEVSALADGTYYGEAEIGNYVYRVEVAVLEGAITDIRAVDNRESPYAFYAEGVFGKIIRDQNANTDAVTGATTTSKALMKAVENALVK